MPGYHAYNAVRCAMYGDQAKYHITPAEFAHTVIYYSSYCRPVIGQAGLWLYAGGWAVVAAVAGFFFFWWAETRYGRG
jgi:teichoic acid transport system permease protein